MNPSLPPENTALSLRQWRRRAIIVLLLLALLIAALAMLPFLQPEAGQPVRWGSIALMIAAFLLLGLLAARIVAPATQRIRRDMEARLRSKRELGYLFSANPTAMLLIETETLTILRANRKLLDLTNLLPEQVVGNLLNSLLDTGFEANRLLLEKLSSDDMPDGLEVALLDTGQAVIEALVSARAIRLDDRPLLALGFTSINELKSAQQSLEYYATYDELTGMVNRRTGLMFLEKAMARSWREKSALSVIHANLDGLKQANEIYGYAEGDRLLRAAASIMTGLIRTSDFGVRLDADEFLIILPNCLPENAVRIAENLERLLAAITAGDDNRQAIYSIRCGIAGYASERHASADDLIREAGKKSGV